MLTGWCTSAQDTSGHLRSGMQGLLLGVTRGIAGVVAMPIQGAYEDGMSGFLSGILKGAVGAVAKPVAGVLDLASATTAAIRSPSRRMRCVCTDEPHSSSAAVAEGLDTGRARLPRTFRPDDTLLPFNSDLADGQRLLWKLNDGDQVPLCRCDACTSRQLRRSSGMWATGCVWMLWWL